MDRTGRQYVRKLEEALARRGEEARVFTQRDYRLATRWHEEGVPVGLILEILDQRKVAARSLSQIASRVENSWKAVCAGKLREGEERPAAQIEQSGVESVLADALAAAPPESKLRDLILELQDEFRRETPSAVLEAMVVERLPGAVLPEQLQEAEEQARAGVEPHGRRMPPEVIRETIRRGVVARLRRLAGIPRFR